MCIYKVVQQLVFELFQLIARHGVSTEDLKHLIRLFDTDRAPVVRLSVNCSHFTLHVATVNFRIYTVFQKKRHPLLLR